MITKLCGGWLNILCKNATKALLAVDLEWFTGKKMLHELLGKIAVVMMVNMILMKLMLLKTRTLKMQL